MLGANSNERRQLPLLARNGHADSVPQCPLSGAKLKTFALIELFPVLTQMRHRPVVVLRIQRMTVISI